MGGGGFGIGNRTLVGVVFRLVGSKGSMGNSARQDSRNSKVSLYLAFAFPDR